ncbi:DUF397 domain-containing protein [Streptomyces albogriseolus]|uniref:DUF397 domain-containing protein n=1 Tax=Streptomyces albogriseolus TaxID=1887 RepID=UPI003818CE06
MVCFPQATSAHSSAGELAWFKSSYSSTNGGDCVEGAITPGAVHVRARSSRRERCWPSPGSRGPRSPPGRVRSASDDERARGASVPRPEAPRAVSSAGSEGELLSQQCLVKP